MQNENVLVETLVVLTTARDRMVKVNAKTAKQLVAKATKRMQRTRTVAEKAKAPIRIVASYAERSQTHRIGKTHAQRGIRQMPFNQIRIQATLVQQLVEMGKMATKSQ